MTGRDDAGGPAAGCRVPPGEGPWCALGNNGGLRLA
jgi:hypothetical protein